jgi:CDP-diacylglycerol--glycerol-3-phosphate 3-phosphatidyltransferase
MEHLPNLLGLFRIVTTPLLVVLILWGTSFGYVAALILLLLMAISDIVDGKLARHLNVVSPLGVFLDTTSDKIFVTAALIPMVERGLIPGWIALVIIIRDFVISGLRSFAAAEGEVISARQWGKQKLVLTVTALVWCLTDASINVWPDPIVASSTSFQGAFAWFSSLWPVPMALALIWTIGSGVEYFWKAWPLLAGQKPAPALPPSTAQPLPPDLMRKK